MGPAECGPDILIVPVQRFVSTECIRNQCTGETSQELLDIALAPGFSILVQDDRLFLAMLRSPVDKHVRLGITGSTILCHLTGGLICLDDFLGTQMFLQSVINIVKMKNGSGKSRVLLYTVPARTDLPKIINWNPKFLSNESFILVLGESLIGPVTVNLSKIPHILLGGSTGSGKSVLLKLLLMQAVQKGAQVYISDLKEGVDFADIWHERCRMCIDMDATLELLEELTAELRRRKKLFSTAKQPNIDRYNAATGEKLQRYIFACDEITEILDKTSLTKEQKEIAVKIEGRLSTIARMGRAFGIHLILATQRPDSNVFSGQVKNNINCRICGRADMVLSQIILDNTSAAELIPKDTSGRFLLHDGTVFQAYWFDENTM